MSEDIHIAAALILDPAGRTLLVRKAGTRAFQQAGGKIDPGESPTSALIRELQEEIGLSVAPERLAPLGRFSAPAANEPGRTVVAEMFLLRLVADQHIKAAAEIAEVVWVDPGAPGDLVLAPLTARQILPHWTSMVQADPDLGQDRSGKTGRSHDPLAER